MPNFVSLQACRRILLDGPTNNLSLIDVLEEITLMASQNVYGEQISLVSLWEKDPSCSGRDENFTYKITLNKPDNAPAGQAFELSQAIPANSERLRSMLTLVGLPTRETGRYEWVVELLRGADWEVVGRLPLIVRRVDVPPPGEPEGLQDSVLNPSSEVSSAEG